MDAEKNTKAKGARLVAALMAHDTLKDAAEAAGIPYGTARRLMRDPDVVNALAELRQEAAREAVLEAATLARLARETLPQVMEDAGASTHARVRAAEAALAYARAIDDLFDIDARLAALEADKDEREHADDHYPPSGLSGGWPHK